MDGEKVLRAIRAMKARLHYVIDFSVSRPNMDQFAWVTRSSVESFYLAARDQHQSSLAEYRDAVTALDSCGYNIADTWRYVDIGEPQVCFSSLPQRDYISGELVVCPRLVGRC